ncbi:hypothetical protein VTN96DRAFT_9464 [Rasamsonia emersonii]
MVSDAHRLSGPPKGDPSSGQAPHGQSIDSIHRTPSITAPCKADVPFSAGSWQSRTNLRSPQAHEFAFQTDRGDRLAAVGGCRNPQSHAAPPAVASGPVTASGRTRQNFHRMAVGRDKSAAQQTNNPSTDRPIQHGLWTIDYRVCSPPSSCHDSTGVNKAVWQPANPEYRISTE